MHDELLLVDVGHGEYRLQPFGIHGFQPHRLPNAGGAGVHAAVAVQTLALLSSQLVAATQVVLHPHHQVVACSRLYLPADVEGERRACAIVRAHFMAVDEDMCLVVGGTEVQANLATSPLRRDANLSLIPHGRNEVGVADARQLAFRTERHGNLTLQAGDILPAAFMARQSEVEVEVPSAVQAQPVSPLELRTGIFTAWYGFCGDGRWPLCQCGCRGIYRQRHSAKCNQ